MTQADSARDSRTRNDVPWRHEDRRPASYRGPAVFMPGEPPRAGLMALLDPDGEARTTVTLVLPLDSGPRRTRLPATVMSMRAAIPWLAGLDTDGVEPSLDALARIVRGALGVIARGRLHPSWTAGNIDCWRVGPLDDDDAAWVASLAASLPLLLRAVPVSPTTDWVWAPAALVRECWDAVADTMVRTAAADLGRGVVPFAGRIPVPVTALRRWLARMDPMRDARALPGVRLEISGDPAEPARAVAFVRSSAEPAVAVDAGDLASLEGPEASGFGASAALQLLDSLWRVEHLWPPVAELLDAPFPDRVEVADEDIDALLGSAGAAIEAEGVEVLLPEGIETLASIEMVAAIDGTWEPLADGIFSLEAICDFRWEPTLDGRRLTPEEVAYLRSSSRPLVRLRGEWVRTDPRMRARLARKGGRLRAGEALGAALSGTLEEDGGAVALRAGEALARVVAEVRLLGAPPPVEQPASLAATLRPYQLGGLAWLAQASRLGLGGCLADDMGLGKTVQVIALHLHRSAGPMLVVCPASMLGTWERELHRFAPSLTVRRFHGTERHLADIGPTEVVLATYGLARRDAAVLAEVSWDLVIADEAQHIKNPSSAAARAMRGIGSRARIALTGTPIENRLTDLWAILDWTTPGLLGSLEAFRRRVARPVERHGDHEVAQRFARTVRPFLLRRRKSDPDVAPELPPRTEVDLVVALTSEQSALYEAVVQETLTAIRSSRGMARRGLVLRLLTALKQVCNHPAHYLRQEGPLAGRSGKLDALDELLEVIVAAGESTLVFTQYVVMARLLEAHLATRGIGTAFLHGGVPVLKRDRLVQRFQDGEVPVFLLSLRAGGVGLNLTRATHVIHYDRWWNPAVEDQATDRAHRIGQEAPVEVHRLITEGTLEDRIAELLAGKRALAQSVIGGAAAEGWISELSDDDLADLVALQRVG